MCVAGYELADINFLNDLNMSDRLSQELSKFTFGSLIPIKREGEKMFYFWKDRN